MIQSFTLRRLRILRSWGHAGLLLCFLVTLVGQLALAAPRAANPSALPMDYTLIVNPTAVHPGGVMRVNGSGYTPHTTYYLRLSGEAKGGAPQPGGFGEAITQTVTTNSQGQVYALFTFDPLGNYSGINMLCISASPDGFPPLACADISVLPRMVPSTTPSQGAPGSAVYFTVTDLEAGELLIDLNGQVVHGPVPVSAGNAMGRFSLPRYPLGKPGDVLKMTFLNRVKGLPMGMSSVSFTLLASPPAPEYEFADLVITPAHIAPGLPFTLTGQIVATGSEATLLPLTAQNASVNVLWQNPATGQKFPVRNLRTLVETGGHFLATGEGASILEGDALSIVDGLSLNLMGEISDAGVIIPILGDVSAPAPITQTLQIQAVDVATEEGIPGVITTFQYLCTTEMKYNRIQCGGLEYHSGSRDSNVDEISEALHDLHEGGLPYGQLTDANGNATVRLVSEKVIANPLTWQNLDALFGQGLEEQWGEMPSRPVGEWTPPWPGYEKYEITVSGQGSDGMGRYFYDDPALPPDSRTTFHMVVWYSPSAADLFAEDGTEILLNEPFVVPMHKIPVPDPHQNGPILALAVNWGEKSQHTYQGWPLYSGFLDFKLLEDNGIVVSGVLPEIEVTFYWPAEVDSPIEPSLWLDGDWQANFTPMGGDLFRAILPYPHPWEMIHGNMHELTLKAWWGPLEDPLERHVYLQTTPAAPWLLTTNGYSTRSIFYDFSARAFKFSAQDAASYGASQVSSSAAQTPETGPLTNNLAPSLALLQTISSTGFGSMDATGASTAPQALSHLGAGSTGTASGSGTSFTFIDKDYAPLFSMYLPLYAAALTDPLGGWIVTITSGASLRVLANLYIDGIVTFDPATGATTTSLTLDSQSVVEGSMFLTIDVLLGFLAHGSMNVTPGISLNMPLKLVNGDLQTNQICFGYWMGMSYYIGGLCACLPVVGCGCVFEDSDYFVLFSGSRPDGCAYTALSQIVPEARRYGPPAPGEPACVEPPVVAQSPEMFHPALTTDGLGQVTAAWKGDRHTLQLADYDFLANQWVVQAEDLTTLGAEVPDLAYYLPGAAVVTWNAYSGDEDILPTLPFTDAMRTTYVAWGVRINHHLTEMGTLAEDANGAGGAVLGSCMNNTTGCPSGGQVTAVWMVDRVPGMADLRTRLYYRIYQDNAWGAVGAIPLDSNDSDAQPQVLYVNGQPRIAFVRDADGSFVTTGDRRLAFFAPANPTVVEIPSELPNYIVQYSAAVDPDGELRLAFNRIDEPGQVGLIDNRHPLYSAQRSCGGSCAWSYARLHDAYGRAIYAESPVLTVNSEGEAVIAYRALGMGPLPGQNGNEFDFSPQHGDTPGLIAHTGEQASLSLGSFDQDVVSPAYLTSDGAVNWETASVYDPFSQQTFQVGARYGTGVRSEVFGGVVSNLGVTARPLTLEAPLTFATLADLPDFAVYADTPASPYISATHPASVTVLVQNLGTSWNSDGQPLRIAATWDALDGEGLPAGEALLNGMSAGSSITVTLALTLPVNTAITHTLYIQALPSGLVSERSNANNTAMLTLGGLPAPEQVRAAAQNGIDFVLLDWAAVPDERVAGYRIYRAVDGGEFVEAGSALETEWVDMNAPLNHTYAYRVTAFTADGAESLPSQSTVVGIVDLPFPSVLYLPVVRR